MSQKLPHESASLHVSGEAVYVDDILVNDQLLVGRVVYSPHAHARIKSFDLSEAKKVPGVHAVLCHKDIPGHNQMGPVVKDELCLAENEVTCVGQARGVTLRDCRALLEVLLPGQVLSVAELGRRTQAAGKKAGAVLAVLDEAARQQVREAAADEI